MSNYKFRLSQHRLDREMSTPARLAFFRPALCALSQGAGFFIYLKGVSELEEQIVYSCKNGGDYTEERMCAVIDDWIAIQRHFVHLEEEFKGKLRKVIYRYLLANLTWQCPYTLLREVDEDEILGFIKETSRLHRIEASETAEEGEDIDYYGVAGEVFSNYTNDQKAGMLNFLLGYFEKDEKFLKALYRAKIVTDEREAKK